ncbi:CerR family C-terminal domain-containing protein [Roseimaritima sediminicola]|uniref:CerR family C-terminal domain-containing protein n=1 Tax=Roseimaritima sediminicola TaxID=2662066 RepID=UPI001387630F|nr:CerR family C-terminal domain-containing protein [Roseimaritima sediminicola]
MSDPVPHEAAAPHEEATRQRILEAAGPIFAQRGFDKATVREICAAAGVNIASVGYYFGDKMGLYLAIVRWIRSQREQTFPMPRLNGPLEDRLYRQILTLLQRMLDGDDSGWEAQLMMREMQRPTEAFHEMVQEYFRPLLEQLKATIGGLLEQAGQERIEPYQLDQLALSVVGQCLYYRVGSEVLQIIVASEQRRRHFDTGSLARHITAFTLAALTQGVYFDLLDRSPCEFDA